eukprot:2151603-Ditylum_brightwellii.AAC.1
MSSSSGIPEWVNHPYDAIIAGYKSIVVSSWLYDNELNGVNAKCSIFSILKKHLVQKLLAQE